MWQDRLRKLDHPTAMSIKLQAEVDKYKVEPNRVDEIAYHCPFISLNIFGFRKMDTCLSIFEYLRF